MEAIDKEIVDKFINLLNKNLYVIITEYEKQTGVPFDIGCHRDVETLLNFMHGAVELIVPTLNEANKRNTYHEGDLV